MRLLTARWVFPVTSPPIADGAVAIRAGEIVGVGTRAHLVADYPTADRWDLEEAALLPGLVNCHTHLELPALSPPATDDAFVEWLVGVIEGRRQLSLEAQVSCIEVGVRALLESHARDCPCCRALVSTYDLTVRLSAEALDGEVPDDVAEAVRALALRAAREGTG